MLILEQIAGGAEASGRRRGEDLLLIPDRRAAIAAAFERARPGDVVLLAGKGHETGILYADHEQPWDERAVAEELLALDLARDVYVDPEARTALMTQTRRDTLMQAQIIAATIRFSPAAPVARCASTIGR